MPWRTLIVGLLMGTLGGVFAESVPFALAVHEAGLVMLLLAVFDWAYLPSVNIEDVIFRRDDESDINAMSRAALIRGWFTLMAAIVIGVALLQYT